MLSMSQAHYKVVVADAKRALADKVANDALWKKIDDHMMTSVHGSMKKELAAFIVAAAKAHKSIVASLNAAIAEIGAVLAKSEQRSAALNALVPLFSF